MYVCGCVQYIRLVWRPSCPNTALHLPRALFFFLFLSTLQHHHHHHHEITTQLSYSTLSALHHHHHWHLNITAQIIIFKNVIICGQGPVFILIILVKALALSALFAISSELLYLTIASGLHHHILEIALFCFYTREYLKLPTVFSFHYSHT